MQIVATKVHEPTAVDPSFTVEFEGDGGERVSVVMAQSASGGLTRENALEKAQVILLQAGNFGSVSEGGPDRNPDAEPSAAVESLIQEREEGDEKESQLQEGLEDTFPASDPVSSTYTSTATRDQQR